MKLHRKWLSCLVVLAVAAICLLVLPTQAEAASASDLTFALNSDGASYSVTDCKTSASGKLVIPATYNGKPVTSIGDDAFYRCTSLTSIAIPDSVTTIGEYAFSYCDSLKSITIPDSVTSIDERAFQYCDSLTGIWVDENNPQYSSDSYGVLFNKDKTKLVSAPGGMSGRYTIPDSVTTIGKSAFSCCWCLTSITIPDSVTTIGDGAFQSCGLTSITIGNSVTTIGDSAFEWCTSLTSITIPDSVTTIGDSAFCHCDSLKSITIPDSVTSIGNSAFFRCTSLTSVTIPDSVTTIGNYAFEDCYNLTSITIPDSVTTIGNYAFYDCDSLPSITIPDSVTSIGKGAFEYCRSLTSVTIGNSVTSIGDDAFYYCYSLTSITIPDSVTSIGNNAFYLCDSLTGIWVDENNPQYSSDSYGVLFNKDKTKLVSALSGMSGSYTIPDSVTSIGDYAFKYCWSLTSITIPDSVTSIGYSAFDSCKSLTSITIPDSVTTIGNSAFSGCTSLTSITIPDSVTSIGDDAFSWCDRLTSITIPDSVTSIGSRVFQYCSSLTSITIPDSVTTIGNYAFDSCDSLTNVTIGNSVTTIGNYAFSYCKSLTSITIGNSVTTIGDDAFYNCDSLTSITIPDSVTTIGQYAFCSCDSLTNVTIGNNVTTIGDRAFSGCDSLTSITIPDSVTTIGNYAFYGCTALDTVQYKGTEDQWNAITIGKYNTNLTNATIVYNYDHEHSYNAVVTAPTCTATGYTTYTCSICGDTYTANEIAPLGHIFDKEVVDSKYLKSAATTAAAAIYYKSCACGESSKGTANEATFTYGSKIPTNAVARIGDDYFTTMDAAIAAAIANGGEIVILKAQTTANALTISGNVTIDFGGLAYTASKIPTGMTYAPIITITEGATVTLKNGTVQVRAANKTLFNYVIENHGTLITENLAIKGQNTYAPNTETATIKNYGTLTLGEGTTILYKVNALLSTTDTVTKVAALELAAPAGTHWADNTDLQFHTFDQEVAAKVYRKQAATTTATGVYYKSCTCGESSKGTASEATFTFGDLVPEKAVARVGENNYYNSIKSALSAAIANGEEVELVKSLSGAAIVINGDVTVDFGGFTYTVTTYNDQEASPAFIIAEGATVTLKNGKIQIRYTKRLLFNYLVENNGTLYTENFTLSGNNLHAADGNATIYNNGTLILGEGTVMTAGLDGINLKSTNLNITKVRSVTVTGVEGYHWVSGQTLTAHVYDKESIQIQHRKSAPNMNSPAIYYTSCSCGENSKGTAYEATFLYGEKGSNALAEAEIDGYYYRYFDDALAAALENGSTVKLLKDLVTAKPLILNSDVTIDFNGCTYTVNQPTTGVHGYAVAVTIGENAKVNFIGGRLQIRYNRRHLFNYLIENNGTLTATNITLRGQNVYEPGPSSDTAAILNTGSVTLNAGTVVEIRVNAVNTTNANVTKDANIVLKEAKGYHWSDDQTQLMPHVFDQEIVDINYRKSAATINSPAIFYKTCSCGVNAKGLDENATFEYGNRLGGAAAKVGNTYYASIEEAIAAAIESGETVEVQMAIKNAKALVISGDVTIDFGGYLYTVNTAISDEIGAVITIANGAKVTLKNGTVQVASAVGGKFNALIENNGELYVENIALKGANVSASGAVLVKGNAMTEGEGVTKVDPAK